MSETGPWMPMYWADYLADTMHLTTEEHGAYLLLIAAYWRRGKALPDDENFLRNCAKISSHKWKKVRENLSSFFIISDGVWKHKRLEYEILKSTDRLHSARASGRAGGLAKSKLPTPTPTKKKEKDSYGVQKENSEFEKFWKAYPHRGEASDPKKPARQKFDAAIKAGVSPSQIIAGAERYAANCQRNGTDPKFVAQASTWLGQERWDDQPPPKPGFDRRIDDPGLL